MTEWFYLTFGFALFFSLLGDGRRTHPWRRSFRLTFGLALVLIVDILTTALLWAPSERGDLRLIFLFFWALLINQWIFSGGSKEKTSLPILPSATFAALLGFSLWTAAREEGLGAGKPFLEGLSMPLASAGLEWLLSGLRQRIRICSLPSALEGEPIFFWLAMLLFLALSGFRWFEVPEGVRLPNLPIFS